MVKQMIYALSCLMIAIISIFLATHCKYEDGLVGRIALAGMAIGGLVVFSEWAWDGRTYEVNGATLLITMSCAAFMTRHAYRFIRWRRTGVNDWRKNGKNSKAKN